MKHSPNRIHPTSTEVRRLSLVCVAISFFAFATNAQTTSFTFQSTLPGEITPATSTYQMEFRLFDAATEGAQIGAAVTIAEVLVKNRAFAVQLDFGAAAFPGADRFVEIRIRHSSDEPFTVIATRQQILSVPYAIRALSAATADNALNLGGVDVSDFVQTTDTRLSDSRDPNPGSNNYIQNTTTQQTPANFNISGNGTAGGTLSGNTVNATTQYNIGGSRVLSVAGTNNTFTGINAGAANMSGQGNAFFGTNAGAANTSGNFNAVFGSFAGIFNTTGIRNAFFGTNSGRANTDGDDNSFFGTNAGFNNTTGLRNAFFGSQAGIGNLTGNDNSFFGTNAGFNNTASSNSFFGANAGLNNTTGSNNVFVGLGAGDTNTTGSSNSFVGRGAGSANTNGAANSYFGDSAGAASTTGFFNVFFGAQAGSINTDGGNNTFVGTFAGNSNTTGDNNTVVGVNADVGSGNLSFATAIGAGAIVSTNSTIVLGRSGGGDTVFVPGLLQVNTLGAAGATTLCRNASNQFSTCSSSLRYKTNIAPFGFGLNLVNRLQPITFKWRDGGMADLGLGAEDVAAIEPLLVTYNAAGEVEGVKYDRIGVVILNAVKEQQASIEAQQKQINEQKALIENLRLLVCRHNAQAAVCKVK